MTDRDPFESKSRFAVLVNEANGFPNPVPFGSNPAAPGGPGGMTEGAKRMAKRGKRREQDEMIKAFRERELATMIGSKHAAQIGLAVEPLRPEEMICGYCRKSMRPGQIAWLDGIRCHASCAQTAARFFFNYLGTGTPSAAPSAPEVTPIR